MRHVTSSEDRPVLGMAMRTIGATSFALMAALLKAASEHGADPMEMVFYRSISALPLVFLWAVLSTGLGSLRTRRPIAHLTRSAIGLTTMVFTFGALSRLPLGEATTITYTAPIFGTILSAVLLGEVIGGRRWAAVAIGFVGMLLVMRPGGSALPPFGVAMAAASALGNSAVMITLRQIGKTETTAAIVFWFTCCCTIVSGALLPVFGHTHDATTYALLIAGGLIGGVGQITMTTSLRFAPVSVVVPFDYLQIIWATLIGWLVFADAPTGMTIGGAGLIAASGIYTAYRERRLGRLAGQALAPPEG